MKMPPVLGWIVSLCVLASLTSCGLFHRKPAPIQPVISRPEVVTLSVPAYKPLPSELTSPLLLPPRPIGWCTDGHGLPAICVLDALATIPAYQEVIELCNRDRARAALFGVTDGQ